MPIDFRGLQERLRKRLLAHIDAGELTGLQLARATGFQQAHISNFLNRKRGLSLEAMDAILRAVPISLEELVNAPGMGRRRPRPQGSGCEDFVSIPIVADEDCVATQVPKMAPRDTVKLASSLVRRLPEAMHTPRPHWQRFIAFRVKPADAAAMSPALTRHSVAVIDRHHNAVDEARSASGDMYLVRTPEAFHIRHVEIAGEFLLARPHQADFAVEVLGPRNSPDAYAAIIGRLCLLQVQL